MKRIIALLLIVLSVATMAGCAKSNSDSGSGDNSTGFAEDGYARGNFNDTMHTYFFDFTIESAYVCSEFEGYTPAAGNELLVVETVVKNTFTETITMYDTDFQAQWNDDADDAFNFPVTDYSFSSEVLPEAYDLKVNESRTGLLVYEVPEGHDDFSVSSQEAFETDNIEDAYGDVFFVYFTAERK